MGLLLSSRGSAARVVERHRLAPLITATVFLVVVGCSGSGHSGSSAEDGRAMAAEAIEADLREAAAASGITVPADLRPSSEQLDAIADEKLERFELERQLQAFQGCLREAGFEVNDRGWDAKQNRPDYSVTRTSDGPTAFGANPYADPSYLRCYGEHYALVDIAWQRQSLPSVEEVRERARGLLECAAEAGVQTSTLGELTPVILQALQQATMGQPGTLDDETAKALVACHERYEITTGSEAEMEQLFAERLR